MSGAQITLGRSPSPKRVQTGLRFLKGMAVRPSGWTRVFRAHTGEYRTVSKTTRPTPQLLSREQVRKITTISDYRIRELVRDGLFPRPIKLADANKAGKKLWLLTDIESWIESRRVAAHAEARP